MGKRHRWDDDRTGEKPRLSGQYRRKPWGRPGMVVRVSAKPKSKTLFIMHDERGVIATAPTTSALAELAEAEGWVVTYRYFTADGAEHWVSVPR